MKILHKYGDGTMKVAYKDGQIGLLPPIEMIDVKMMVIKGDNTYSTTLAGQASVIEGQEDARWIRVCGTHYSELIFKIVINAGKVCAKAFGDEAFEHFSRCILPIREIICKNEKSITE